MTVTSPFPRVRPRRIAILAAGLAAVAAGAAAVLGGGPAYRVEAHFIHGSELVEGAAVRVAGRTVGKVGRIGLTRNGLAAVRLDITDGRFIPLRAGTRARVRALSQSGIASRYVEISPGLPGAAPLTDGGVLTTASTTSAVNIDAVLGSLGPRRRVEVRRLVAAGAELYAGSAGPAHADMLRRFSPAVAQLQRLTSELAQDNGALREIIDRGAQAMQAIALRREDLESTIAQSARAISSLAEQRQPLDNALGRAERVLLQGTATLVDTRGALRVLRPALDAAPAVGRPLDATLKLLVAVGPRARPALERLASQLPAVERALRATDTLEPVARPALRSAGRALRDLGPIASAFRPYGPDLLLGVLNGLAGVATANHGIWGKYARLEFTQPPQTTLGGPLANLLTPRPLAPGLIDLRTRLLRRCPGAAAPPAPDGSNPWVPDPTLCTPAHNVPADVNDP